MILHFNRLQLILKFVIIDRTDFLAYWRKVSCHYLKFGRTNKRPSAGMSSYKIAEITLRTAADLAELAEEGFSVISCGFHFFTKSLSDSLCLTFRTKIAAI